MQASRQTMRFLAPTVWLILTQAEVWGADLIADFEGTGLPEGSLVTTEIPGLSITGGKLVTEGDPQESFGTLGFGGDVVRE